MDNEADTDTRPVQFSLRGMFTLLTAAAFLAAVGQAGIFSYFSVLFVIYVVKFLICCAHTSQRNMLILYAMLLVALLPYTFYCDPFDFYGGRETLLWRIYEWAASSFGVFLIPTISFLVFDIRRKWCAPWHYLLRSVIEFVVILPVWWCAWSLIGVLMGWYPYFGYGV
jgi:hypothetical protein